MKGHFGTTSGGATVADLTLPQLPAQQARIALQLVPLRRVSSERLTPDVADSPIWTPARQMYVVYDTAVLTFWRWHGDDGAGE